MLETLQVYFDRLLGLHTQAHELEFSQMAFRALVVFVFGVFIARLADRRVLGHNAGFDIMLLVVLGSVLSRGINGQAAFFPSLGASLVLIMLHHVVASLTFHSHWFSNLVKGGPRLLVRDGKIDREALRRSKFTEDDLNENLRLNGGVQGAADVAEARLERNGSVSVVKAKRGE